MKKKNFNKIVRGDDYIVKLTLTDDGNNPVDLTNAQLDLHARNQNDELVLTLSTTDNSIEIVQPNIAIIKFSHESTKDLAIEPLNYDLQLKTADNKRKTLLFGNITLLADITRV